ncbi:MAG: putative 6-phospho-beta-glucosidase [Syntrophomonadaceae bacterium]|nr:putative 6-phospho-beta-glucosidase [Bacillota bacterium]
MEISKIGVIGGGSSYTPELIEGIISQASHLQVKEMVLMDIDPRRLEIVGALATRMVNKVGLPTEIALSSSLEQTLEGANFVITQVRVGGIAGRILDEKIPLAYGLIGQETTGPGGFSLALRTIPVVQKIAEELSRRSPDAWLINFTNPSGLITEAVRRSSPIKVVGLCNGPISMRKYVAHLMGLPAKDLYIRTIGLNHLNWADQILGQGENLLSQVIQTISCHPELIDTGYFPFAPDLLQSLQLLPCAYLQYYYNREEKLNQLKKATKTRGEEVAELDGRLLLKYADSNLEEKPKELEARGGIWYSEAAIELISSIVNDKGDIHTLNVVNNGAILDLPEDAVVEIPCLVRREAVYPLSVGRLPLAVRGLVQAVKSYEQLTIEAALEGSYSKALQALLAHPLVPSFGLAKQVLDAFLGAQKDYLRQFG